MRARRRLRRGGGTFVVRVPRALARGRYAVTVRLTGQTRARLRQPLRIR